MHAMYPYRYLNPGDSQVEAGEAFTSCGCGLQGCQASHSRRRAQVVGDHRRRSGLPVLTAALGVARKSWWGAATARDCRPRYMKAVLPELVPVCTEHVGYLEGASDRLQITATRGCENNLNYRHVFGKESASLLL